MPITIGAKQESDFTDPIGMLGTVIAGLNAS